MNTSIWKRAAIGAGLALTLPFGLAACGDDSDTDVETVEEEDAPTRGGGDSEDLDDTEDDMEDDG